MLHYTEQKPPASVAKHYTPAQLANALVKLVRVEKNDVVLDPCAGTNRVFYKAFPGRKMKCELDDGEDFLESSFAYDWAITNPPYHLLWKFIDKTSVEARKGFAFLVNINGINTLTPRRLGLLKERGFIMRRIHVCNVKRWFGRYYFYVFSKQDGECALSWDITPWQ